MRSLPKNPLPGATGVSTIRVDLCMGAGVELTPELRDRLVRKLELCLANTDRLDAYLGYLRKKLGDQRRNVELVLNTHIATIVQSGLSILPDHHLVYLATHPESLVSLYKHIVCAAGPAEPTEYWARRMSEARRPPTKD